MFFDLRELRRAEAFATIYSVLFVLGAACAFLLFVRDVIEREVVSPLEWVHTMLSTKTAEAYGTLRRAIAFSDRAMERKQRMDPTERMFSQLAKMVLCFRRASRPLRLTAFGMRSPLVLFCLLGEVTRAPAMARFV